MPEDLYRTLNVSPAATQAEIQTAYRSLARRYHPDRNPLPSASTLMVTINAAYEILGEPEKRAAYDRKNVKREESPVDNAVLAGARDNLVRQGWTAVEESTNQFRLKNGSRHVQVALTKWLDHATLRRQVIRASAFTVILAVHVDPNLKIPAGSVAVIDLMHSKKVGGEFPDSAYEELFRKFF
jgi:curved DNA-binding protein CbpA